MSRAVRIENIDNLDHFITRFKAYNAELTQNLSRAQADFRNLNDDWRDPQYEHFAARLKELETNIKRYLETAPEYEAHLDRVSQRAHDLIDQGRNI